MEIRLTKILFQFGVDLFVWGFYFSKGFLGAKIRAELDIRKHQKHIEKKYNELENMKTVPDEELIKNFPDKIFVPTNVCVDHLRLLARNVRQIQLYAGRMRWSLVKRG